MVSSFNPGRNIGRVSIRVLPDTRDFNKVLRRQLDDVVKTMNAAVKIDKANIDREALKRDMQRQIAVMSLDGLAANVEVTIDRAKLKKVELRKSIQEQFDQFENIIVKINAEIANAEHFQHEVNKMVREASRNEVKISANAFTAVAAAQFRYTARDRVVTFFAKVNEASLIKTATALAALSGSRLAYNWIDDLAEMAKSLDENLPSILGWTTGITSIVGGLFALTSGVVGLGQGFVSMLPALLVLPGLAQNAIGSITALIVAWRNAGTELSSLSDDMSELGEIINTTYWDAARQPILDLVNGLMPQLRTAFHDLSQGVGEFTGALAQAFGAELSGGRLESIFAGIADGWRVLGTGASGFAGAIVSLSQIAAIYTPRLAAWFVRQANTFDAWLEAIATDGRLSDWMEGAIKSMYDLWDATTGIAGVFEGLWRAAESAGSGGLAGFADLMQTWEATVKSADFQRGLEAVFRGSYVAMSAFGDAVEAIGRLVADLDQEFERFIGSSGEFFGGLVEGIADALNSPEVAAGLDGLSSGLLAGLAEIKPSLQPIADTFGSFLGLLGDLAETVLPFAVDAIADLMPSVDALVDAIEPALPGLTDAASKVVDALAPAVADLLEALAPTVVDALLGFADAVVDLTPAIAQFVDGVTEMVNGLNAWSVSNKSFFDNLALAVTPENFRWEVSLEQMIGDQLRSASGWVLQSFTFDASDKASVEAWADAIIRVYRDRLSTGGTEAGSAFLSGLNQIDLPGELRAKLEESFGPDFEGEFEERGRSGGGGFSRGLTQGISLEQLGVETAIDGIKTSIDTRLSDSALFLLGRGSEMVGGLKTGAEGGVGPLREMFGGIGTSINTDMSNAKNLLLGRGGETVAGFKTGAEGNVPLVNALFGGIPAMIVGKFIRPLELIWGAGNAIMTGFMNGLKSVWGSVTSFVSGIAPWIARNKGPEAYDKQLLVNQGEWIMGGLQRGLETGFGRVKSRVSSMAGEIRDEFDTAFGSADLTVGMSSSLDAVRAASAANGVKVKGDAYATDSAAPNVNVTFVNPVTRDTEQDAWEAAQIIGGVRV